VILIFFQFYKPSYSLNISNILPYFKINFKKAEKQHQVSSIEYRAKKEKEKIKRVAFFFPFNYSIKVYTNEYINIK